MSWVWWVGLGVTALLGGLIGLFYSHAVLIFPFGFGPRPSRIQQLKGFSKGAAFTAASIVIADGMVAAAPYVYKGYLKLMDFMGLEVTELLMGAVVVLLGYAAYIFKKKKKSAYGTVEIIFAASTAIVTAKQISAQGKLFPALATLGGCVYVVARGLSNIGGGEVKKPSIA